MKGHFFQHVLQVSRVLPYLDKPHVKLGEKPGIDGERMGNGPSRIDVAQDFRKHLLESRVIGLLGEDPERAGEGDAGAVQGCHFTHADDQFR